MKSDKTKWGFVFLLAGLLASIVDRAYYFWFFLPSYHGSYVESVKQFVEIKGFVAFIKTAPGAALTGGTAICFLIAAIFLFLPESFGAKQANQSPESDA